MIKRAAVVLVIGALAFGMVAVFSLTEKSDDVGITSTPKVDERSLDTWYQPRPGASWQWQLNGELDKSHDVDVYDIDLFDTSKEHIEEFQRRGIKVICYFSAGSYEDWRPDKNDFPQPVLGNILDGWENERWLDIAQVTLLAPIMEGRLDLAKQKGCDGVEPDNVDGYQNESGFSLTYGDQLRYNKWLAREAHRRGLSIALKNDLDQVDDLVDDFDFAVNEQCFAYDECEMLLPFVAQEKAVFGVEYALQLEKFCDKAIAMQFSWLKMDFDLAGGRTPCE